MNKKTLIIASVIVLGLIGVYVFVQNSDVVNSPDTSNITTNEVRAPFSFQDLTKGESTLLPSYKNSKTDDMVSFVLDKSVQARNQAYEVNVNGVKIGTVGVQGISEAEFSPDGKYFSLKSRTVCGATCFDFIINVIDIENKKISTINPPKEEKGKTSFIESYDWKDGAIQLVFYYVTDARVSAKEIWEYNLNTQKYTLLKTIAE